jgi:hypothetical protein
MAKSTTLIQGLLGQFRRTVLPTETVGHMGTAVYGGYVQSNEKQAELQGTERYRTFSELLADISIVAAGTRYFLNLVARSAWTLEPSDDDTDGKYAELAEEMLTDDPRSSWHRIVRRAAMYRFYGFSTQEWTARRRDDGIITLADVAPRAQLTIERWDVDARGDVLGVIQRSPQDGSEIYLPRQKLLYVVDDTLSDSPEGLGLFRHLVSPARRLRRYEQLEGWGYEGDLRGTPVARLPYREIRARVQDGRMTAADAAAALGPVNQFLSNHVKSPQLGLALDSETYQTADDKETPTAQRKWDIDLLKAGTTSLSDVGPAIERLNREMARILGVESLLLGSTGSQALSRDKTNNLYLMADSCLGEVRGSVDDDLLWTLWQLNGWDPKFMPKPKTEAVRFNDVEQIAAALRDMAMAGAVLDPDDPAIGEIRDLLGLSRPLASMSIDLEDDARLNGAGSNTPEGAGDEDEVPGDETRNNTQE